MRLGKLIGKIHERYGNVISFSKAIGMDIAYLSRLVNGKYDFRKSTVIKIADALCISPSEYAEYFFPEKCEDATQSNG